MINYNLDDWTLYPYNIELGQPSDRLIKTPNYSLNLKYYANYSKHGFH